jgi:hypothetical protein
MGILNETDMRGYLTSSITSLNSNKLNGLLAEVRFRETLENLGFADRVSPGGWIARREGSGVFGSETIAFFPEVILPTETYPIDRALPSPSHGLHTICATLHQSGIASYFCAARVNADHNARSVNWFGTQLGIPNPTNYEAFPSLLQDRFRCRQRNYNFLRYATDVSTVPTTAVFEEFSKENVRVNFQSAYFSEISDIDGIFWGQQHTYPVEIKEKTPGNDGDLGEYFGLDVGPFVKLAFYAAKRGNLHSLFIVREIDNAQDRNLVQWWMITFDRMAQFASWNFRSGGPNMGGGASAVIRVPKSEFTAVNQQTLNSL